MDYYSQTFGFLNLEQLIVGNFDLIKYLPLEISEIILNLLPLKSLLIASNVSNNWKKIINSSKKLREKMNKRKYMEYWCKKYWYLHSNKKNILLKNSKGEILGRANLEDEDKFAETLWNIYKPKNFNIRKNEIVKYKISNKKIRL